MYRWRGRAFQWAVLAVAATMAAGCSQTVAGTMQRARPNVPDAGRSYGYVDNQCGLLLDDSIKATLAADSIVRPYSGAVCRYVLQRKAGLIDVVFSWFEAGTLGRERALAEARGVQITDVEVERHPAYLARASAAACSATAAAGSGVLTWWVQYRPQSDDPCQGAQRLLAATLSADM